MEANVPDSRCLRCGYSLRGLAPSSLCPECGATAPDDIFSVCYPEQIARGLRTCTWSLGFLFAGVALLLMEMPICGGFACFLSATLRATAIWVLYWLGDLRVISDLRRNRVSLWLVSIIELFALLLFALAFLHYIVAAYLLATIAITSVVLLSYTATRIARSHEHETVLRQLSVGRFVLLLLPTSLAPVLLFAPSGAFGAALWGHLIHATVLTLIGFGHLGNALLALSTSIDNEFGRFYERPQP